MVKDNDSVIPSQYAPATELSAGKMVASFMQNNLAGSKRKRSPGTSALRSPAQQNYTAAGTGEQQLLTPSGLAQRGSKVGTDGKNRYDKRTSTN